MSWEDRLREASYKSPSGVELAFIYGDVGRSVSRKTSAFEFPDFDGTFVQDLGRTGRRYPLRLIFSGADHDQEADAFLSALEERGVGVLTHPRYGAVDVIPFGDITQRDDLVTAANQTVLEVTFWETVRQLFPEASATPAGTVEGLADDADAASGQALEDGVDLDTGSKVSAFKAAYQNTLDATSEALSKVAAATDSVKRTFDSITRSINNSIDVLVGDPLTLGFQTVALIQAPGAAAAQIRARLDAYGNLLNQITGAGTPSDANSMANASLYAEVYLSALARASVLDELTTQPEAIEVADEISTLFDSWVAWRDQANADLDIVDDNATYGPTSTLIGAAVGALVTRAFDLRTALTVITDRPRTIIDLS
jgi:prophage DNA circulation protein